MAHDSSLNFLAFILASVGHAYSKNKADRNDSLAVSLSDDRR